MDRPKYKVGDQFILTITGTTPMENGDTLYLCDQFNDYPLLEESELDNLIPVVHNTLCYTNGYRVGYRDGYEDALDRMSQWMQEVLGGRNDEFLDKRISDCELTVRASNVLLNNDIHTIRELVSQTPRDLMSMKYMGKKSFSEINDFLRRNGLHLKGEASGNGQVR